MSAKEAWEYIAGAFLAAEAWRHHAGELRAQLAAITAERDELQRANAALAKVNAALRGGDPEPSFCAYCLDVLPVGDAEKMIEHLLGCENHPVGIMERECRRLEAERDAIAEACAKECDRLKAIASARAKESNGYTASSLHMEAVGHERAAHQIRAGAWRKHLEPAP